MRQQDEPKGPWVITSIDPPGPHSPRDLTWKQIVAFGVSNIGYLVRALNNVAAAVEGKK